MDHERIEVEGPADLAAAAAAWLAAEIGGAAARRGECSLALAGGRTPRPAYERLATLPGVPWPAVSVFFGDERAVPPQHPDSNYRMAYDALLSRAPIPPERIHRMEAERRDLAQAAQEYAAVLPDSLDVVLLGMGADGHIASLFPHSPALAEQTRRVVPVAGGLPVTDRLTITPPVLASARHLLVLATGKGKAAAVRRALEGPVEAAALPAQLARSGTWILDRAAAAELGRSAR